MTSNFTRDGSMFTCYMYTGLFVIHKHTLASFPGLLTPAFVTCSTNALQATNTGVRRPGNEASNTLCIGEGDMTGSICTSELCQLLTENVLPDLLVIGLAGSRAMG